MSAEVVLLSVDARGVATITLNRPRVNNAYDGEMIRALHEHALCCASDPAVRVVVLRGNGAHFQAGADLAWIGEIAARGEEENRAVSRRTATALSELDALAKPTVALVHGGCFGGGVGLIACCDVVLASEDARFAISEVRWGLVPDIIVPQLNAAIGRRQVRRFALSGERFDAHTAKAIGLVHEICPPGGLDAAAAPVIDALLLSAPEAVAQTKAAVRAGGGVAPDDEDFERLVRAHALKRRSREAAEGLACFAEKRKPRWYPQR
ncbi:MAG: enoyl-CoA hydratase-related protein [Gammaproteobacteria bacterium]|nr:enoyl-CoA hydratase-related protein [Gammaproteobacteria bacterium]